MKGLIIIFDQCVQRSLENILLCGLFENNRYLTNI